MRSTSLTACVLLLLDLASGYDDHQRGSKRLIVFGDSFSDDGSGAWVASNHTWPADPAYAGHHFSNGPVWAQDVSSELDLHLKDYATGGATADNKIVQGETGSDSTIPVPSVVDQVNSFLDENEVCSEDIFVLWIGANDVLFDPNITAQAVVGVLEGQIHRLQKLGGRQFILASYPFFDLLPAEADATESQTKSLRHYSTQLTEQLKKLAAQFRGPVHVSLANVQELTQKIFASPSTFGFKYGYVHPPTACLIGTYADSGPRKLCSDPNKHFFWDAYHPTYRAHRFIAKLFVEIIKKSCT